MREIKFRAWHKHWKCMLRVRAMTFNNNETKHPTEVYAVMTIDQDGNLEDNNYPDNIILLQYIGLKDRHGKEICEGDIFNFHSSEEWKGTEPDNPCIVFWSSDLSAFMFYVGKLEMSTLLPPSDSIEIIGNIYENPDLLKKR